MRRHSPETKAAAIAAVATGERPSEVARRFGISQGRLTEWCAGKLPELPEGETRHNPHMTPGQFAGPIAKARENEELVDLVRELAAESVKALTAQARYAARDDWLKEQSASGLAEYRGVEFDRLLRLLQAFQPADDGEPAAGEYAIHGEAAG